MVSIYRIPIELIEHIASFITISNIIKLSIVNKKYYNYKNNLIEYFINNNPLYANYNKKYNIDLYKIFLKSSCVINSLEIDNKRFYKIKNRNDTCNETIKATLNIFKFMLFTNNNKENNNIFILNELTEYIDDVYNLKYDISKNENDVHKFKYIFKNYYNNINLYNIYEIYKFISLKKYKLFTDNIYNNFYLNNITETDDEEQMSCISFLLYAINYFTYKKMKIYIVYIMFKYFNDLLDYNNNIIMKNINFKQTLLNKCDELNKDILYINNKHIPKYLKNNVNDLIIKVKNKVLNMKI